MSVRGCNQGSKKWSTATHKQAYGIKVMRRFKGSCGESGILSHTFSKIIGSLASQQTHTAWNVPRGDTYHLSTSEWGRSRISRRLECAWVADML
jgi:hypothetical protein